MSPIFIILFAIFLTTVLTISAARRDDLSPRVRRLLWILAAVGVAAFLVVFLARGMIE